MGIDLRVLGRIIELRASGSVRGRELVHWIDVVKDTAARCDARVFILGELVPGFRISTADLASVCRASFSMMPLVGGLAVVTPLGFERMVARVAIAITSPPYEVGYFEEAWRARDWLAKLAGESLPTCASSGHHSAEPSSI